MKTFVVLYIIRYRLKSGILRAYVYSNCRKCSDRTVTRFRNLMWSQRTQTLSINFDRSWCIYNTLNCIGTRVASIHIMCYVAHYIPDINIMVSSRQAPAEATTAGRRSRNCIPYVPSFMSLCVPKQFRLLSNHYYYYYYYYSVIGLAVLGVFAIHITMAFRNE